MKEKIRVKISDPDCTCGNCYIETWIPESVLHTVYGIGKTVAAIAYPLLVIPALIVRGIASGWSNANHFVSQSIISHKRLRMTKDEIEAERAERVTNVGPMTAMMRRMGVESGCKPKGQVH